MKFHQQYRSAIRWGLLPSALLVTGNLAFSQEKIQKVPISAVRTDAGAAMFSSYCASCHGTNGKGGGPAAAALRGTPPDLTILARNNSGAFPSDRVMTTLGRIPSAGAHGSADMPLWGEVFRHSQHSETVTQLRLYNLTRYLESLQDPPARKRLPAGKDEMPTRLLALPANSGAEMYRWLCAGCHGATGQGDGPALSSLQSVPTNLTHLTRTHEGKFPSLHLTSMLDKDPGTPAHGSKEMPIWGNSFRGSGEDPNVVRLRIRNLVDFLKTLQAP
jgi:mono/diheme cytochrome c family protein